MSKDPDPYPETEKPRRLPLIRVAIVLILGALTAIIVFQNTESVETRILFATIVMPRAVLLFTTCALGFILGMVVSFLHRRSKK